MARTIQDHEREYIIWQNRSFRFYFGARLCYLNDLYAPAAFSGQHALESLLKGTLVYWRATTDPRKLGHDFPKLMKVLASKVPGASGGEVPVYFGADQR